MNKEQFKNRTKMFAINTAKLCKTLSYDSIIKSYVDQIVRASAWSALITELLAEQNQRRILLMR